MTGCLGETSQPVYDSLQAFGQGLLRLVTPKGGVLDPTQVLIEAGLRLAWFFLKKNSPGSGVHLCKLSSMDTT